MIRVQIITNRAIEYIPDKEVDKEDKEDARFPESFPNQDLCVSVRDLEFTHKQKALSQLLSRSKKLAKNGN